MDKGIYCLVLRSRPCNIRIGRLGDRQFPDGWLVYVGSALGPGGLKRVARHIRLAREKDRKPRWHIDYLTLSHHVILERVVCAPTARQLECTLAREIGGDSVAGFGCSDCSCHSHLFIRSTDPEGEILNAFRRIGLDAKSKTIIYCGHEA